MPSVLSHCWLDIMKSCIETKDKRAFLDLCFILVVTVTKMIIDVLSSVLQIETSPNRR